MNRGVVIKALFFIVLGIIMGAFGAHYLENILENKELATLQTGVDYQIYSGIILLILGLNYDSFKFTIKLPTNLFFIGACCFSFSLYLLSLFYNTGIVKVIWPVTPIGGLLMILALVLLILKLIKKN